MHLITGYSGTAHITSANDGEVNSHIFGSGSYVFNSRTKFRADIENVNTVKINGGEGLHNGRYFEIPSGTYDTANIDNGSANTSRIDLIVARYTKDSSTSVESMNIVVIKGTASASPVAPAYEIGNVLDGVGVSDFPLYKVYIDGLTLTRVEAMFTVRKDIFTDVSEDNDNTVAEIAADNSETARIIAESNSDTLEAIQTDNANTLRDVQLDNVATINTINGIAATMLTMNELWTNPTPTVNPETITHPTINGYKYVEVLFSVMDTVIVGDDERNRYYMSSGKIPVINSKVSTILSFTENDWSMMGGGENIINHTLTMTIDGTTTELLAASMYGINNTYKEVIDGYVHEIIYDGVLEDEDGNYYGIVVNKILGYK